MTDPYANVRAAFREVTLGLMEWNDPPLWFPLPPLEDSPRTWTPPVGDDVEPFDVQADWDELA